ncbi:MAG: Bax inhibitor-1/YccA family protein [Nevskia sp.]|jgi:modulator of FtsH protease|nr:Bax inhibitor-1/YccA family protein [Nevskia sp.]
MNSPNDYRVTTLGSARTTGSGVSELLATHTVLRNTYILLAATLLFSAAMAAVSIVFNIGRLPSLLVLGGSLGLLFWVQAARNSAWGLLAVFAFTGFMGLMTGPIVQAYVRFIPNGANVVMMALGGTGAIFVALSAYALISKRDFSKLGSVMIIGAVVLMVASIANIFLHISGLSLAISAAAMVVFSGLMLYDTGRILDGGETNYISATVALYLDIYNVFISLLNLLGNSNRN